MGKGKLGSGIAKPVEVKWRDDAKTIHDIDMFAHGEMKYNYKEIVPEIDGQTLALMFPRGAEPEIHEYNLGNKQFVKKWYWFWNYYNQLVNVIMEQWKWKGLPKELPYFVIETLLAKEGSCAIVKIEDKYIACAYSKNVESIYDEANEITINTENKETNGKTFKEGEFVIIRNDNFCSSVFINISQYMEALYDVLEQLRKNIFVSAPKGVFINKAYTESNGKLKPITMSLNAIANGSDTFYTLSLGEDEYNISMDAKKQLLRAENLFIPIEFTDRTDNLIKNSEYWNNLVKERCGVNINLNFEKKERVNQAEVSTQNGISSNIIKHKFSMRKYACEQLKEIFKLNVDIELVEDEMKQEMIEPQKKGKTEYVSEKLL